MLRGSLAFEGRQSKTHDAHPKDFSSRYPKTGERWDYTPAAITTLVSGASRHASTIQHEGPKERHDSGTETGKITSHASGGAAGLPHVGLKTGRRRDPLLLLGGFAVA